MQDLSAIANMCIHAFVPSIRIYSDLLVYAESRVGILNPGLFFKSRVHKFVYSGSKIKSTFANYNLSVAKFIHILVKINIPSVLIIFYLEQQH